MKKIAVAAFSLTLLIIIAATVSPIGMRPAVIVTTDVDRMLAFAGLTGFVVLAYPKRWRYALAGALILPPAIELLQFFVPTRHAMVEDAVVKMIGGLCGCFFALAACKIAELVRSKFVSYRHALSVQRFFALNDRTELPVRSRMIKSVYFSPQNGRLLIRLSDGKERLFDGVTPDDAQAMITAPSPGTFYLKEFRPKFQKVA